MIHFTERLKINEDYYDWVEKVRKEKGYEIRDCALSVVTFLSEKGFLNETAIHKEYLKGEQE